MSDLLFEGSVLFDADGVSGQSTGLRALGSTDKMAIKRNVEIIRSTTKELERYGNVTGSAAVPGPSDVSLVLKNLSAPNLAMAVGGDVVALSQGSGTFTEQPLTAHVGNYVEIGFRNITAASDVLTNEAGDTTYVRNTDYELNHRLGWLRVLPGGAITQGQALKLSGAYAAATGQRVRGAVKTLLRGRLVLDGRNLMTGQRVLVSIKRVSLSSDSELDFLSNEPMTAAFSGSVELPADNSEPFTIDLLDD